MKIKEIKQGDIVIYKNKRINYVNKPSEYRKHYKNNFKNKNNDENLDIVEIKRYYKILFFYKLKTIYKRKEK